MWHPSVSALTGYRAGRFPAWEQLPGNLHTSKLLLHSTTKTLGHLRQSWPALFLLRAVGCPVACLPADVAVPRESTTLILLRATGATLALETRTFLSHFAAAFSSFRLGSSPGMAGSTSLASSHLACSSGCCHCSTARHLPARMWSHTAQQLAKLRAMLLGDLICTHLRGASHKPRM